jgi:hypothetical protein
MDEEGNVQIEGKDESETKKPVTFRGKTEQQSLFSEATQPESKKPKSDSIEEKPEKNGLVNLFRKKSKTAHHYAMKPKLSLELESEFLPEATDDFEERVLAHIDFGPVIGDRERVKAGLKKVDRDVFDTEGKKIEESDVYAYLEPEEVAKKAQQLVFTFDDIDRSIFPKLLLEKFENTLVEMGMEAPQDLEILERQLDLVIVRNPKLLREAYKKCRVPQVSLKKIALPAEWTSETWLEPSQKNLYGVFPEGLNADELAVSRLLDADPNVDWWHRNPVRKPESVALYGWADGEGFFPDFVLKIHGRKTGDGIALLEVKGPHIRDSEKRKASAVHKKYGRVYMTGRKRIGKKGFAFFRFEDEKLQEDGTFEPVRMKWPE